MLCVLFAGFMLRLALHDYHGLEGDDAFSLALSRYALPALLDGLARLELDIHPPLHFLALKAWTVLGGESLLALRLMNILADMLTGALVMRLGGRVAGRRVALLAGALWLAAPLLIYATYLIRMYTLMALFTTGGAVCIAQARSGRRVLWYGGAAVCGLLAAYTHIIGGLVLAALALSMLVAWRGTATRRLSALAGGLVVFGVAGLLYLPYFGAVWALYQSGRPLGAEIAEASFSDPLSALAASLLALLSHRALGSGFVGLVLVVWLVIGAFALWRSQGGRAAPLIALTWAGLLGMAVLAWVAGMYKARYLVPFVPPLLVLVAGALLPAGNHWRRSPLQVGVILAFFAMSIYGLLNDLEREFRDDWTAAAAFVEQHERPGDTIIVIPDWGQEAFRYHYGGAAMVTGVFPRVPDDAPLDSTLDALRAGHDRVWLVRYQPEVADPAGRAEAWFRERAALVTEVFPSGMHLKYYDFAPVIDSLPADARPLDAQFADSMRLHGVYQPVTHGSARDTRLHPPSNWVQVWLYWEALNDGAEITPRVRFTDVYGQVYGSALERETRPQPDFMPGHISQVAYDLNLNPDTPPGTYNIEVMVLDSAGEPLPASGADAGDFWVIAGQFVVE